MKLIFLFICLSVFTIAQDFHFKMEQDNKNKLLWTLSYPQKVSGTFVCRLVFNDKDEIVDSRLWLQFKNRKFSYNYQTNNRKILKGKYTLEIFPKSTKTTQSIPRNFDFFIGTTQEIIQQHYDYIELFFSFSEYLKEFSTTLQKERADLQKEDIQQQQIVKWYHNKGKTLDKWQKKVEYFFYPNAITSYDFAIQQSTLTALKISRKIVDRHVKWLFAQKSLEDLSPPFADILTQDLSDLEKQLYTLQEQIRIRILAATKSYDIQKVLTQISHRKSTDSVGSLKEELQLQQLIFTKNKHNKVAKLLKEIEQTLENTKALAHKKQQQQLKILIDETRQIIKNIHLAKNAYDKNYFFSILKKLTKEKGLNQFSTQQLKTLEININKIKKHKCYRSFLGLVYWIKVYKMYKKLSEGAQKEFYVEKSKLSIKLLVAELQDCLE